MPGTLPKDRRRRQRVLLAEDDEDIRSVFEMVLAEYYDITCAETAAQALALADSLCPDVILLDWTLPDASGEEVAIRLRAMRPEIATIPIVLVSGASTVQALAERIGAVSCPKPCDVDQLVGAIERALDTKNSG
jgi:DNA-binding NtrC family response regulator